MNWYLDVLKNYVGFSGRARRKEYWMSYLINIIIMVILAMLTMISESLSVLYGIYALAVVLPFLAVGIRRLHDIDKSGWWTLISLIPFGSIVLLVFYCQDSDPSHNQYGHNPKTGA